MFQLNLIDNYNTWETSGRGRKQCPSCKKYCPIALSVCNCNYLFFIKPNDFIVAQIKETEQKKINLNTKNYLDPIYLEMRKVADECLFTKTPFETLDPGGFNLNDRAEAMYQLRHHEFKVWIKKLREKAYEKILEAKYGKYENNKEEWRWAAHIIEDSITQRTQPSVGGFIRDLFCYFLKIEGIDVQSEYKRIDALINGWLKASVKHSMRDRENDKDHLVQVFYLADAQNKMWQLFKDHNAIVIVINNSHKDYSRKERERKLIKNGINLTLHTLDSGIIQIKKRLEEHEKIGTAT